MKYYLWDCTKGDSVCLINRWPKFSGAAYSFAYSLDSTCFSIWVIPYILKNLSTPNVTVLPFRPSSPVLRWCYTGRFLRKHSCAKNLYTCNITNNLLQQRCKKFKVVQHVAATNVGLKIVVRRHVTRIDFLCNNVALKIVVKNRPRVLCNITFSRRIHIKPHNRRLPTF